MLISEKKKFVIQAFFEHTIIYVDLNRKTNVALMLIAVKNKGIRAFFRHNVNYFSFVENSLWR